MIFSKNSVYYVLTSLPASIVFIQLIHNVTWTVVSTFTWNQSFDSILFFFFFRHMFESLKAYCLIQMSSIPMTFVLGFYVSLIVKRWWDQYNLLPWPDSLAIFIAGLINGIDERGRLMRRNIMRYVLLSYVITLRRVSFRYSAGNLVLPQINFRVQTWAA